MISPQEESALREKLASGETARMREALEYVENTLLPPEDGDEATCRLIHETAERWEMTADWERCRNLYLQVIGCAEIDPAMRAAALFRLGLCAEELSAYREAMSAYGRVVNQWDAAPGIAVQCAWRLARLLVVSDDIPAALPLLKRILGSSAHPAALRGAAARTQARCLIQMGQPAGAEEALRAVLPEALGEEGPAVRMDLGALLEKRGAAAEAAELYRAAINDPYSPEQIRRALVLRLEKLG